MAAQRTSHTDVLIVGAGPTGLTLALELAAHNVNFRIVDRDAQPSPRSRALVVQPRTLELLRRHGVAETLVREGNIGAGARFYVNGRRALDVPLGGGADANTAFPQPLWISQARTEALLADRLRTEYGVAVQRGVAVRQEDIRQDATGVDVSLAVGGGADGDEAQAERVRCSFVVGCDGAHSVVRHAAGLSFAGSAYPQRFILCDVHLLWDELDRSRITAFLSNEGIMVLFPFADGTARLISTTKPVADTEHDEPTLQEFRDMFDRVVPGSNAKLDDPLWLASFHLHHRGVGNYRSGRLFVAGDAAHIHSPAGGQGMNTGIQDAVNLGWKLALALSSKNSDASSNDRLLDSYDAERRPVGQKLLGFTDRVFWYGASTNLVFLWLRNLLVRWVVPWYMKIAPYFKKSPARQQQQQQQGGGARGGFYGFISQLRIRYRKSSPIVATAKGFVGGPVAGGDRAPDGLVRTASTAAGDDSGAGESFLLELCPANTHALLLFASPGQQRSDDNSNIVLARHRFAEVLRGSALSDTPIHTIYHHADEAVEDAAANNDGGAELVDVNGNLHRAYGFDNGAGYVLVRPDAYVAHIGTQSAVDEFAAWLKDHY